MGNLCASSKPAYVASWFFYADPTFDLEAKTTFTHLCGDTLCVNPRHLAVYGALGLLNDESVLQFIASRHPKARKNLLSAMKNLSPKLLKKPTSGARKAIPR